MYINVPQNFSRKDIKRYGTIFKDKHYYYILSDIKNRDKSNTIKLNSLGYFSYIYNVCNSYLFIIGNQIKNKDINPNRVDFLSKILKFEYLQRNKNKKIQRIEIPSKIFTITTKERWLQDDILKENKKEIDYIIKHKKVHLQSHKSPYERYMMYLCDNSLEGLGVFEHGLCKDLMTQNFIHIMKDTSIDGYIIKTDNTEFL